MIRPLPIDTRLRPYVRLGSQGLSGRVMTLTTLAAVFLSPYTTWRLIPDALFTFSDGLFCLSTMLLLASSRQDITPFRDLTPLWLGALGLMMMGLFIGSAVNGDLGRWLIVAAQYCFAYGLLPIAFGAWDRTAALQAAKALTAGVVAMELFGTIVYVVTGGDSDRASIFGAEFITGAHRLGGFMADANWNGAISAMAIPFVMFLHALGRLGSAITLGALLVLGSGVVLSGSFTGFTSAALSVALFLLVGGNKRSLRMFVIFAVTCSLTLAAGVGLPTAFQHRVANALENRDINEAGTYAGRMELIEEAWGLVDRTPIVGIGVDQFRVLSADEAPVHNMYLLVWAEGGVFALIGWLVIAVLPIIAAIRSLRRDYQAAGLVLAVASVFLVFSVAAPHMYSRSWVVPMLIAMATLFTRKDETEAKA
jgi:O-antigen ligase